MLIPGVTPSTGTRVAVTVPTSANLDGDDLVLYDITGTEMFRGNVRGPEGPAVDVFDGGTEF